MKDRQHIEQFHAKDDLFASPKAKGERLRRIRHLANLSREAFCADGEINLTTLISWEIGRFGGLSKKGAARVIARVAQEGVFCTPEWLLYEIGVGPEVRGDFKKLHHQANDHDDEMTTISQNEIIVKELMFFRSLNKNTIDFIVNDDAMLPHYQVGDYVAGVKRYGSKIGSLISLDCIVQLNDGRVLMRNLQAGPDSSFNLIPTNLKTQTCDALFYSVELIAAAPVLWHRRKDR